MCGLPGAGKTTFAKRLERERPALRLTADEWMFALFPDPDVGEVRKGEPDLRRAAIEALQLEIALRALVLGIDVVIDWGLWSREERDACRARARAVGARSELVFLDLPRDELWRRIAARNAEPGAFRIERASLDLWSTWFEPPTPDELAGARAQGPA